MRADIRENRIKELILRLNEGHDVQRKDLQRILTEEEFKELDLNWKKEKQLAVNKPTEIVLYEKLLKTANLHYSRYESMNAKKYDEIKTELMLHLAENKYYKAIEFASEIIRINLYNSIWFDRSVLDSTPCPMGMPQIITSRSNLNNQKENSALIFRRISKRENKLHALTNALEKLQPQVLFDPFNFYSFPKINKQIQDFSDFKFDG